MKDPPHKPASHKRGPATSADKPVPPTLEYEEILVAPVWVRVLVYVVFLVLIGFFLLYPIFDELANEVLNLSLSIVFVIILWMVRFFLSLRVSVFNKGIQFGFYIFNKRFEYSDVLDCKPFRYQLSDYLGWGIRKGADGSILYNVPGDHGTAVKLTVRERDERMVYAFSAKRPEVICKRVGSHLRPVQP
jgi:hypothetical protein